MRAIKGGEEQDWSNLIYLLKARVALNQAMLALAKLDGLDHGDRSLVDTWYADLWRTWQQLGTACGATQAYLTADAPTPPNPKEYAHGS